MTFRHGEDRRVVIIAAITFNLDDAVLGATGQHFDIGRDFSLAAIDIIGRIFRRFFTRHNVTIDDETTIDHLHTITGQTNHALDVIGRTIARQFEHCDIAALGFRRPDAPLRQFNRLRHNPRQRVRHLRQREARIAVGIFRHEEIVANQQGRDQRA